MLHTRLHHAGPGVDVIEVEGVLDAVGAYDLRRQLQASLDRAPGAISLDLSQVSVLDEDGVAALHWCVRRAESAGVPLGCTAWSRPALVALRDLGDEARRVPTVLNGYGHSS